MPLRASTANLTDCRELYTMQEVCTPLQHYSAKSAARVSFHKSLIYTDTDKDWTSFVSPVGLHSATARYLTAAEPSCCCDAQGRLQVPLSGLCALQAWQLLSWLPAQGCQNLSEHLWQFALASRCAVCSGSPGSPAHAPAAARAPSSLQEDPDTPACVQRPRALLRHLQKCLGCCSGCCLAWPPQMVMLPGCL